MNQAWVNDKKPNFGPDSGPLDPNLDVKNFFHGFYLCQMLEIVACYHCIQFQEKLKTEPNSKKWQKKTYFDLYLGPLGPNSDHKIFFMKLVGRKLISLWDWFWPVWPKFGPQFFFSWISPLLDDRHCWKLSFCAISRKAYDPNSSKWRKTLFWAWFRPIKPKFEPPFFFFFFWKIWLCQSLDIMIRYQNVKYEKTN